MGFDCLPLTRLDEGDYIRESEVVVTSILRVRQVEGEKREDANAKAVQPATDPHGDDDEGKRCRE